MLLIILSLMLNISHSSENIHLDIMKNFQDNYNNDKYEIIYNLYNSDFQAFLNREKSDNFLSSLKSSLGKIQSYEYSGLNANNFHTFKTQFDVSVMTLLIAIDDNNKISGLSIKPFVEKSKIKYENKSKLPAIYESLIIDKLNNYSNNTQLSIATIKDGKVNFFGLKIEDNKVVDVNNKDKIFEIGSLTKVFSSVLLANFVVDNKVNLNDNINDYLDYKIKNDVKISFKSLANHTSGLPRIPQNLEITEASISNPYVNYKEQDLKEYLINELEIDESKSYSYSNLGAALIPYVLSKIDKKEIKQLFKDYIFKKYKMKNTYCDYKDNLEIIKGIDADGNEVQNWDFDVLFGAGGILSNVEDLSKFLLAFEGKNNKELKLTLEKTYSNQDLEIGLAWHQVHYADLKFMWHNGGTGGYSSSMAYHDKTKTGVIILTNISSFHPKNELIDKICYDLIEIIQ